MLWDQEYCLFKPRTGEVFKLGRGNLWNFSPSSISDRKATVVIPILGTEEHRRGLLLEVIKAKLKFLSSTLSIGDIENFVRSLIEWCGNDYVEKWFYNELLESFDSRTLGTFHDYLYLLDK